MELPRRSSRTVIGGSLDEVRRQLERMLECLEKPALEYQNDRYVEVNLDVR